MQALKGLKHLTKAISILIMILYPLLVFSGLYYMEASPKSFSIGAVGFVLVYFLANNESRQKNPIKQFQFWGMLSFISIIAAISYFTENIGAFKVYPILINLMLLIVFFSTLIKGPSIIYRFALMDKRVKNTKDKEPIEQYCTKVTWVWIIFFVINGIIATITTFWYSIEVWTLYNGLIAYILMGLIFGIEFIIRTKLHLHD